MPLPFMREETKEVCGRYHRTRADNEFIKDAYGVKELDELPMEIRISYNVAPQNFQPAVRLGPDTGKRELALMRWGLVLFWAKDSKLAYSTINPKSETITTSPAFRDAFKRRRCLVVADGFFEWQKLDAKTKQPYKIGLKSGELFAFAGIWDRWHDKEACTQLETYTVLTTEPNELMV